MKLKNFTPTAARRLMLTLFLALLTMTAQAADFNVTANGVTWSCTIVSGTNVSIVPADMNSVSASVTIPSSVTYSETNYTVTTIGNRAFYNCTGLTSVTIPASVTTIEEGAFHNCSSLTSVTIPASVTNIGEGAFRNCSNLASVIVNRINAGGAPTLGSNAFNGNAAVRKIYVPSNSYSSFFSDWSAYASDLVSHTPGSGLGTSITANQDPDNTSDYWCTYYNPTYSIEVPASVTIYKAKVNDDKTKVILTEVAGNTITVGQAVVLKKSGSASISLTQKLEAAGDYSGNELKGGSSVTDGYDAYTLASGSAGVGFYKFTGASLTANRAHLELPHVASARGYIGFGDNDGATAIDAPEVAVDSDDGDIYDLMGRKVEGQPARGIYVKQGRKFIVK